jgi:SSS family solute:Na+ symporter
MGKAFTALDFVFFFAALIGVMAVGLIAGRKEDTSEDYFLAGRKIPWWGVAGSIFGSNVSANHMVGMLGLGFSVGFAQAHFELGAVFGLMMLCYGFLPVYRRLKIYTLSEYLERRYDERSRLAYAIIMVVIMAVVQMVPAIYIGSRTICVLLGGDAVNVVTVQNAERPPEVDSPASADRDNDPPEASPATSIKRNVERTYYSAFVIALAAIAAAYTIFGGLKAVVWTDVFQSILLLAAGILLAVLTFHRLGGWGEMMSLDGQAEFPKMQLYLPSDHEELPWTGVFSGLLAMHLFYWGTNQFIVQRTLGAKSDAEARLGIVVAGFLKMLIPFFAIGTGVAAFYLFRNEAPDHTIDPDAAFPALVKMVIPVGFGVIGLISAGVIGAILSSIDSMMNSAATIVTIDIYKRYINPDATDRQMIRVGRIAILLFVVAAATMAITVLDPNSEKNFFMTIVNYSSYLTPGLLVAFLMGIFWKRGTPTASFTVILAGIAFSWLVQFTYDRFSAEFPTIQNYLGSTLNLFHRTFGVIVLCSFLYVLVSLAETPDREKSRLTWSDLGGHSTRSLRKVLLALIASVLFFALMGWAMVAKEVTPTVAGLAAAAWTVAMFLFTIIPAVARRRADDTKVDGENMLISFFREDRSWAAILCALAIFMHYYFY